MECYGDNTAHDQSMVYGLLMLKYDMWSPVDSGCVLLQSREKTMPTPLGYSCRVLVNRMATFNQTIAVMRIPSGPAGFAFTSSKLQTCERGHDVGIQLKFLTMDVEMHPHCNLNV